MTTTIRRRKYYRRRSAWEMHPIGMTVATMIVKALAGDGSKKKKTVQRKIEPRMSEETFNESKRAMPIRGHEYHKKSDEQLRYIIKDAGSAAKAMQNHSPKSEAKYLDQVNDASTVLHYRKNGGKRVAPDSRKNDFGPADEEVVAEVSTKKMGDYIKASNINSNDAISKANALDKANQPDKANDSMDQNYKRQQGRNLANKKLNGKAKVPATEEVVSEMGRDTLKNYTAKAVQDKSRAEGASEREWDKGHFSASYKLSQKATRRSKGLDMAQSRIKEDDDIEEAKTFKDRKGAWDFKKSDNLKKALKKSSAFRSAERGKRSVDDRKLAAEEIETVDETKAIVGQKVRVTNPKAYPKHTVLAISKGHYKLMNANNKRTMKMKRDRIDPINGFTEEIETVDETKAIVGQKIRLTNPKATARHTVLSIGNHHYKVMNHGTKKAGKFTKERVNKVNGFTEETEELDELSSDTVKRYMGDRMKKRSGDLAKDNKNLERSHGKVNDSNDPAHKVKIKATKEEVEEISELSQDALKKYSLKAIYDKDKGRVKGFKVAVAKMRKGNGLPSLGSEVKVASPKAPVITKKKK